MNPFRSGLGALLFITGIVACSPSAFNRDADCGPGCIRVGPEGTRQFTYSAKVSGGLVDILFVDDNSGSMSFEQNKIRNAFNTFISTLDSQLINYRISITTTDVADPANPSANPARAINQGGNIQNGNLIRFSNGAYYLEPGTPNKVSLFSQAIYRNETIVCESYLKSTSSPTTQGYLDNCPSPDERGILAANMTIDSNPNSFIRESSHMAVVFLSDEDARSQLYDKLPNFKLDQRDLPQSLIQNVSSRYPNKSLSMHALIVKPGKINGGLSPSDAAAKIAGVIGANNSIQEEFKPQNIFGAGADVNCLNAQSTQTNNVSGSYGYLYALAARMTNGIEGSICAADYGSQLESIGRNLGRRGHDITLACSNPRIVEISYVGKEGSPQGIIRENVFEIDKSEPVGTEVRLVIECKEI